jgi:NAD(P)-dependent dehydrogenase (short-subunit alcohol dehydrogenase family)
MMGQCQVAVAKAVHVFGRIDILLCCTSQAIIGTVEALAASQRTQKLVRDQFESNFFGPMNIMRAALPEMRTKANGHIIVLGGITGHLGTPGLGMYCASKWALEGFCDSIAYEIAPFNVKVTILQASIEIGILTNKITSAPPLAAYAPDVNNAPPVPRHPGRLAESTS